MLMWLVLCMTGPLSDVQLEGRCIDIDVAPIVYECQQHRPCDGDGVVDLRDFARLQNEWEG